MRGKRMGRSLHAARNRLCYVERLGRRVRRGGKEENSRPATTHDDVTARIFCMQAVPCSMTSRSCTRKRDERRCVGNLDEAIRETGKRCCAVENGKVPDTRHSFPSSASPSLHSTPSFVHVLNAFTPTACSLLVRLSGLFLSSSPGCLQTRVNSAEYMTSSRNLVS
ncbi:uncharacterized protein LOC143424737 [Xylocopa sonorina]|uniref:uncharacterized protein LOC143424737 n=1 Tax=Xylocopa sonorina TaxID=1818115 RepID=UPI00403AB7DB